MVVSDSNTALEFRTEVVNEIDRRLITKTRLVSSSSKRENRELVAAATSELQNLRMFLNEIRFSIVARPGLNPDTAEIATVLAALRFYQEKGHTASDEIHDIATAGGTLVSLDIEAIDRLCQTINLT